MIDGLTTSEVATCDVASMVDDDRPRLPSGSVARELFDQPWKFDFFQAVLVLQELASGESTDSRDDSSTSQASSMTEETSVSRQSSVRQDNKPSGPIGGFVQPAQECLQFTVPSSQAFPGSSIQAVTWDAQQRRPRVSINFMGLTGPSGTLPRSYTSRLQQIELVARHRERHALRDWLDNFNHRFVSLFFDAWAKYRFPIGIRRQAIRSRSRKPTPTLIHVALSSIGGLGLRDVGGSDTSHEPSGDAVKRDELLGLAGLLAQRPMNVSNLQSAAFTLLGSSRVCSPVRGSWLDLEESSQTKLGRDNSKLGRDAFLGERIRTRQQKIRIEVGPLCKEEFSRFLPPAKQTPVRATSDCANWSERVSVPTWSLISSRS
ncbi:MAG: type VI secretion system baseplate subunit TssG [Pirellulaceae bacterium]